MRITLDEIKQISVKDYMESRGFATEQHGSKWFCKSPFSKDTNWSFCIYPTNSFYCWSTGRYGDIITLVCQMEGLDFKGALEHLTSKNYKSYVNNYAKFNKEENVWKDFDYTKYITNDKAEQEAIVSYAQSRSISAGYYCGVYFTRHRNSDNPGKWVRHPAVMFVYQDLEGNICGAKFRKIYVDNTCDGSNGPRFSSRGRLGLYILDTGVPETFAERRVWLCESETSSNSLWEYFKEKNTPAIIVCFGGVSSAPKDLPDQIKHYKRKLIIDYDGSEELYQQRLEKYKHLETEPVKLILPKGEDINSLYHRKEMYKIEHLLK